MYIDTDIVYALIKFEDVHKETAKRILETPEKKYSSIVTIIELELVLKKEMGDGISKDVLKILDDLPHKIAIKEVDEKTISLSIDIRKRYNLGIFDSIHAACALLNDKRIGSTDGSYDRIKELTRIF